MRAIYLAYKDLLQILRDWKAAVFLIVMPVIFTLLFGLAFGGFNTDEPEDPRLPVGYVNEDSDGLVSPFLQDLLAGSEVIRLETEPADADELEQMLDDGDLAAVVIIPPGYSESLLSDGTTIPIIIVDMSNNAGMTAESEIQSAVMRLSSAVDTAQFTSERKEANSISANGDEALRETIAQAVLAWQEPPVRVDKIVATVSGQTEEQTTEANAFTHTSPGMMAQFAIAGLMGAAAVLVLERKNRSLQRLLTSPITRSEILIGHFLAMFVMIIVQLLILIFFGQLFLDLKYFQQPFATLSLVAVSALFAASLGLLIGALAKNEDQVTIFSLIPMFILAGFGGAWVPLEITPEAFQAIARLTPLAWMIDGFKDILIRGGGFEMIWPSILALSGYAVVIFVIASWRFRYE